RQPLPVPNTPSAATITATLPMASLREQIQTERMFASPQRYRYSINATPALTASAAKPTTPIVAASGGTPSRRFHSDLISTNTPNAPMHAALKTAALERADAAMPRTGSDSA